MVCSLRHCCLMCDVIVAWEEVGSVCENLSLDWHCIRRDCRFWSGTTTNCIFKVFGETFYVPFKNVSYRKEYLDDSQRGCHV